MGPCPPPSPRLAHLAPTPGPAVAMVGDVREEAQADAASGLLLCMEIIWHPTNFYESSSSSICGCYQL